MIAPNLIAAKAIETNASSLAATACNFFIREQPGMGEQGSKDMYESWSTHFRQRVLELSAAVAAGEPDIFLSRVDWSRQAMVARHIENVDLADSLQKIRIAVTQLLPANSTAEALHCIDEAIASYANEVSEPELSQLDPGLPEQRLALFYLQAALEGNVGEAMDVVLQAIKDGLDPRRAITDVLLAAQREVGHLWHLDQLTITEEHLVTTTTERLMAVIASQSPRAPARNKTVVAASIAGNAHDVGIRAIAYLMEMDGWRVIYLGSDVPRSSLPAAIHFYDTDLVMLSLTLSSHLANLHDTIAAVRTTADRPVKIMVGGNAFRDAPSSWQAMGADGFADSAIDATKRAAELLENHVTH